MTAADRPFWWRPDLSQHDIASWEAAEREAERGAREAPILPGSDIAIKLQSLIGDDLRKVVRERLEREKRQRSPRPAA